MPVKSRNKGNKKGFKYTAISIIYFISPPPRIILGIINNSITKKSKIVKEIIIEYIESSDSKTPNEIRNNNSAKRLILGIL